MSLKDIQDYFTIVDDAGSLQNYTGNPDYALDDKWKNISLDDLGLNKDKLTINEKEVQPPVQCLREGGLIYE